MNYFQTITNIAGQLSQDGTCPVTVKWEYPSGDTPDAVEIYHDFYPAELIGQYPSSSKEATILLSTARFSGIILVPRSILNGETQSMTTLDNGQQVYWEALQDKYIVQLPAPPYSHPQKKQPPSKPIIRRVDVGDGSLNVIWDSTEYNTDVDGFQIVFVENGQHLPWHKTKDNARSFRFAPTKAGRLMTLE